MMLDAIDHVHVYVEDLPAAAQWYQQLLGFQHDEAFADWYSQGGPYVIRSGEASLSLFQRSVVTPGNTIAFAIQATKIPALLARLAQFALDYRVVDHQLTWSVYFHDLSGNPLEVTCNDYAAATPVMVAATQKQS